MHNREPSEILSHWHRLFPGFKITPQEFYAEIEKRISYHSFPDIQMGRVEFSERGLLSAKRTYLRILRGDLVFDICGAPFGRDIFFVSYWLGRMQLSGCLAILARLFLVVPGLGFLIEGALTRQTYYQADTSTMFQEAIHSIIMAYVDELAGVYNVSSVPEGERKASVKRFVDF